jgi:hypothetical protein
LARQPVGPAVKEGLHVGWTGLWTSRTSSPSHSACVVEQI